MESTVEDVGAEEARLANARVLLALRACAADLVREFNAARERALNALDIGRVSH